MVTRITENTYNTTPECEQLDQTLGRDLKRHLTKGEAYGRQEVRGQKCPLRVVWETRLTRDATKAAKMQSPNAPDEGDGGSSRCGRLPAAFPQS